MLQQHSAIDWGDLRPLPPEDFELREDGKRFLPLLGKTLEDLIEEWHRNIMEKQISVEEILGYYRGMTGLHYAIKEFYHVVEGPDSLQ